MSLFGKLVRTVVNVVELPFTIAADVVTLGDAAGNRRGTFTTRQLEKIKEEAED